MERVGTLINKLKEQLDQKQDAAKLLLTAQMLLAELQQQQPSSNSGKVSVTMPSVTFVSEIIAEVKNESKPKAVEQPKKAPQNENQTGWLFNPELASIPTLVHQEIVTNEVVDKVEDKKELFELKDTLVTEEEPSLNDILKEEKTEIATVLKGAPIKDLKKAIGINDRYVFINELFRGDEVMYERSIKTINTFNIYAEAEYWIQRELKVKLGWEENNSTVESFNQLVKRRFA
ncbi:MAG TPA: hypothetical protein PKG56_08115 [Chitinophagaceae bacterium]|nr:hypothetical protein [Chitinophagaceae bacterium]MCC6634403.1 hypothetical protein [Chitinophagaceae bacterium]HMZ45884.1 hypothetical protein [Chitinophagaceae bacterium]HNE92834.1 hypothetical protein [Chitinophagaceae bacterium]HNF29178.1 hypothetical protein [Chitinophagaceae bacterium]